MYSLTECVAVADLGLPTPYKVDLVLGNRNHLRIPIAHQLSVLIDLVRLYRMEHNRVDILAPGQDLREAALNVLVKLASLGCAVDERGQRPAFLFATFFLAGAGVFYNPMSAHWSIVIERRVTHSLLAPSASAQPPDRRESSSVFR